MKNKRRELKERNVVFRLTESDVVLIDLIAERESLSRAQVLRRFVRGGLGQEKLVNASVNGD